MAGDDDYIPLRDFSGNGVGSAQTSSDEGEQIRKVTPRGASAVPSHSSAGSDNAAVLTPRRYRGQTIVAHSTSNSKLTTLLDDGSRQATGTSASSSRQRTAEHSRSPPVRHTMTATTADDMEIDGGSSTRGGSSFDSILNDLGAEEEALDNQAIANERARTQEPARGIGALSRMWAQGDSAYQPLDAQGTPHRRRRGSPHDEPIWTRRMLVLPAIMLVSMGLLMAVISTVVWVREHTEHPKLHVNAKLFPYSVDRTQLGSSQYSLRLIHTNDMHAHFSPYDANGDACDPKNSTARCVGGSAYVKAVIDHMRLADGVGAENTVLLNGGDEFQGSLMSVLFRGNASAALLNAFEPEALTLGNHEFDLGPLHLARFLQKVHAPAICANLLFPAGSSGLAALQASVQPFTIIDRHKVGVIGVLTPDAMASSSMDGIKVTDPIAAVNRARAQLNKMGIRRIVVLSHLGYDADRDLAAQADSGIGLIVGSHSHTYLAPPAGDDPNGPADGSESKGAYPTWVSNAADTEWQTAVVQAKSFGEYVGYLDLVFNDDGSLDSKLTHGTPVSVDVASENSIVRGIAPNKRILGILAPFERQAAEFAAKRIGHADAEFTAPVGGKDAAENALGNLVTDAVVWATRQRPTNGTVVLLGTGALRAHLPSGDITRGHLFTTLPYDDHMAAVSLSGSALRAIMASASGNSTALSTVQASGLRHSLTGSTEVRTLVGNLDARPMEGEKWEPLDDAREYEVLAPMFLIAGGDSVFPEDLSAKAWVVFPNYRDWVGLYITRFSPVSPIIDHRK
ncbi:hypothetical protein LPJ66_001140 [Kickxella alabastrina]|uniref:Uncharacterized protein n=1 Tax=Kickxella alabastrina TaxID=61397 RepID=A0ACC1IU53_9FUNG|nr:hypothetical protein LPJ66_001140 [Kickxella alabastrina]